MPLEEIWKPCWINFQKSIRLEEDESHRNFKIGSRGYCFPYVASIYAALELGEALDANCLFEPMDYEFLKYKYGLQMNAAVGNENVSALNKIFELYLPNTPILPYYVFAYSSRCAEVECKKCEDTYLVDTEKFTKQILKWRDYDEIYRAKETIEKIIKNKQVLSGDVSIDEVKKEFLHRQNQVNRNIKKVFPMVKRWTNLTAIIATPLSILSAASGNLAATTAATSMLGLSKAADESMKYYESKNKWVGFINSMVESKS